MQNRKQQAHPQRKVAASATAGQGYPTSKEWVAGLGSDGEGWALGGELGKSDPKNVCLRERNGTLEAHETVRFVAESAGAHSHYPSWQLL